MYDVDVDQEWVSFSADVEWVKQNGVKVERFNLAQQPQAFAENAVVKAMLELAARYLTPTTSIDADAKAASIASSTGCSPTNNQLSPPKAVAAKK